MQVSRFLQPAFSWVGKLSISNKSQESTSPVLAIVSGSFLSVPPSNTCISSLYCILEILDIIENP